MQVALLLLSALSVVRGLTDAELALFTPRLGSDYVEANTGMNPVVWGKDNGDGSQTIYTNGVPSHETWVFPHMSSGNPNQVKAVTTQLKINQTPVMRDEPLRCLPTGTIGIATSGVAIWGWYPAEDGCPDVTDFEELDICEGHPGPSSSGNQYHYHYYSPCVQVQTCGEPSPIYGVALDGIPIYGPVDENGRELTRSDLDECGGRTDSDGRYKYHVTTDPYYTLSCFKGEIRSDSGKNVNQFRCTCPFSDTPFQTKPNNFDGNPVICTGGKGAEPISCDQSGIAALQAAFEYEWKYVETESPMIPCCPSGSDCGNSCKDSNGIKSVCTQETKKINWLTRVRKSDGSGDGDGDSDTGESSSGAGSMAGEGAAAAAAAVAIFTSLITLN